MLSKSITFTLVLMPMMVLMWCCDAAADFLDGAALRLAGQLALQLAADLDVVQVPSRVSTIW
jgi:hypothetical protein